MEDAGEECAWRAEMLLFGDVYKYVDATLLLFESIVIFWLLSLLLLACLFRNRSIINALI